MDIIPLDGLPVPGDAAGACACSSRSRSTPRSACVPLVIPSVVEDIPIPIERIPRHQGTDYAYVKALAHEVGYVFYIDPGPGARREQGLLGPGDPASACRSPRSTSALDGPHDNVDDADASPSTRRRRSCPIVFIQEPYSKAPIPIPIPDVTPLNPPLGLVPPLPPKIKFLKDTAQAEPARRGR